MFLKKLCNNRIISSFSSFKSTQPTSSFMHNIPSFTFATKMRQGVTKNKKDSAGRRLGVKKYGGEEVRQDQIILRQRGFKWKAGENVHAGRDQTLHASKEGKISFTQDPWSRRRRVFVHVVEQEIPNRKLFLPKPFMYHPELYPELAKNNVKAQPLRVKQDIKANAKAEANRQKKAIKDSDIEFRLVSRLHIDPAAKTAPTLRNTLLKSWKASNRLNPEFYSSKFDIEPMFKEMNNIASQYLMPNYKLDNEKYFDRLKYASKAEEKQLNPFPAGLFSTEEEIYTKANFVDRDSTAINSHSYISELYAKYVKNNENVSLKEIMVQMKKEHMMNLHLDIRSVPGDRLDESDKIYIDDKIEMKVELEELVAKFDSISADEVKIICEEMGVETKEESKKMITEKIAKLDSEIAFNYLNFSLLQEKIENTNSSQNNKEEN